MIVSNGLLKSSILCHMYHNTWSDESESSLSWLFSLGGERGGYRESADQIAKLFVWGWITKTICFAMTDNAASQTAYFILSGSGDFPSQACHVILYQWMHVLKNQGVPKTHVSAWAANIENITLLHPKPSLTSDPLSAPDQWDGRLRTGSTFKDGRGQLVNALTEWGADPTVKRVVVIVVGSGHGSSVNVGDGCLDDAALASLPSICGNKPVLFVLDFDWAGMFAELAVAKTKSEV
jgi:hypothetical protein